MNLTKEIKKRWIRTRRLTSKQVWIKVFFTLLVLFILRQLWFHLLGTPQTRILSDEDLLEDIERVWPIPQWTIPHVLGNEAQKDGILPVIIVDEHFEGK